MARPIFRINICGAYFVKIEQTLARPKNHQKSVARPILARPKMNKKRVLARPYMLFLNFRKENW